MGFFNREVDRPEVINRYGPYANQIGDLNAWYADAANRTNQATQQIYGQGGLGGSRSGPLKSKMASNVRDIELARAKQQYDDKYKWLGGTETYFPQKTPSGFSQLVGPAVSGMAYKYGGPALEAMGKRLKDIFGQAYDSITSSPYADVQPSFYGYGGGAGNWGEPGPYSIGEIPSVEMPTWEMPTWDIPTWEMPTWDIPTTAFDIPYGSI